MKRYNIKKFLYSEGMMMILKLYHMQVIKPSPGRNDTHDSN